jgi:hypothetical protein
VRTTHVVDRLEPSGATGVDVPAAPPGTQGRADESRPDLQSYGHLVQQAPDGRHEEERTPWVSR